MSLPQKIVDHAPALVSAGSAVLSVLTYAQVIVSIVAGVVAIVAGVHSIRKSRRK